MGSRGINSDDFSRQYVTALYFVTTTLSTCGFGDIYASPGDPVEAGVIIFLQFVGMLFYSMTIQKVQSFLINDEISAGEYAAHMVDEVENLIVKVGRQLPNEKRIYGKTINSWKNYTREYFRSSPNAFLAENDCYNHLPENIKVKLVKHHLLESFQKRFDVLFMDPEFGFKADDKLITKIIASLSYE